MQSVLRSIKPYWLYLILIGKKTVEVGKDFPKSSSWNREVYLYCSKDRKSFNRIPKEDKKWMRKCLGKIACRFVCGEIVHLDSYFFESVDCMQTYEELISTCLSWQEINDYAAGREALYGWRVTALDVFIEPMELKVAKRNCNGNCLSCKYGVWKHPRSFYDEPKLVACKPITPPQSWCYVEVRG